MLPDLYFRIDADGSILDYKPGKIENLYISTEDCQGKSLQECLPTAICDRLQQAITQVLETQSSVSFEYTLPLPQGNHNFEARLLPLPDLRNHSSCPRHQRQSTSSINRKRCQVSHHY